MVALRKESVDRNVVACCACTSAHAVALRKESVDRNTARKDLQTSVLVALRKESVDRNVYEPVTAHFVRGRSPQGERG